MKQYLELAQRIIDSGEWVENKRTGVRCKTVIDASLEYDVGAGEFPLLTTRKMYPNAAIAELLGYLRGYSNANQFAEIGCNTWHANANENQAWLENPNRQGHGDMGRVYGVQGREWRSIDPNLDPRHFRETDQLLKVYNNLKEGIDDRGEIITFWNPGEFDQGCLRPCMHTHNFSILGDRLFLTSYQRSCDVPLGLAFNMVQCYALLDIMSRVTGIKAGKAYHKIINAHIYENQIPTIMEQLARTPSNIQPGLVISDRIQTLDDVLYKATTDDFQIVNYVPQPAIRHPFTV